MQNLHIDIDRDTFSSSKSFSKEKKARKILVKCIKNQVLSLGLIN